MEKRTVLAMLLIGLVMIIHFWVIMPWLSPKKPAAPAVVSGDNGPRPAHPVALDNAPVTTMRRPDNTPVEAVPHPRQPDPTAPAATPSGPALFVAADNDVEVRNDLIVKNGLLTTRWTNRLTGACLDLTFNEFYTNVKRERKFTLIGEMKSIQSATVNEREPAAMALEFPELHEALANMTMRVARTDDNAIVFTGRIQRRDAEGKLSDFLEIVKTVRAAKDAYEVEVVVAVRNLAAEPATLRYDLRALEGITVEGNYSADARALMSTRNDRGFPVLKTETAGSMKNVWQAGDANVVWAGIDDRYFAALAWAEQAGKPLSMKSATLEPAKARLQPGAALIPTLRVKLTNDLGILPAGGSDVRTFHLFAGPKESGVLDRYPNLELSKLVDYGMWGLGDLLAMPILWLLRGAHYVVRNYGLAILIMTAVIRLALHPLTRKGQIAMAKMQRLKPKITDLQKRFKNDRAKLAEEQMKLFREAKVSPMSGCLPMLLQMPVLFALFYALRQAFELRQSPFVFWMTDLSLPDTVGHLPDSVPLLGGAAINILPILMAVAMFIQQKMQPKAEDEQSRQQQKMMMFLPFLFMFMFYGFPAGLNLYWFASTVIGAGEQWYIQKHINETLGPAKT